MAKKKKVEETLTEKKYYFPHNFVDGETMYLGWQWYVLTQEQYKTYSRVIKLCDCPPEIGKKGDCKCGK